MPKIMDYIPETATLISDGLFKTRTEGSRCVPGPSGSTALLRIYLCIGLESYV